VKRLRLIISVTALAIMVLTAGVIQRLHTKQKLGKPGVVVAKAETESGWEVVLPEKVLDYTSEKLKPLPEELGMLPKDTTYGKRFYTAPDGFVVGVNVVLMGTDRTSIHRPEFCLTGQGWKINKELTVVDTVALSGNDKLLAYNKMLLDKPNEWRNQDGSLGPAKALYFYWFTAEGKETPAQWERMWWMAGDLLREGTLQRWAYVACYTKCLPGQEEEAAKRLKEFIAVVAPQFQITAGAKQANFSNLRETSVSTMLTVSEAHTQK